MNANDNKNENAEYSLAPAYGEQRMQLKKSGVGLLLLIGVLIAALVGTFIYLGEEVARPFLLFILGVLAVFGIFTLFACLLYTSPSPRDLSTSRMPSSA